jgi:hypothetical protein
MKLQTLYARNPWLLSTRTLGVASLFLGGVVLLQMLGGPDVLFASALAMLAIGGLGGITYERRLRARQRLRRSVTCHALGCHDIKNGLTLDLSPSGFFVETEMPYPLLTRFHFELHMDAEEEPMQGTGVVRWINQRTPHGMGVEIVRLDDPVRFSRRLEEEKRRGLVRRLAEVASVQTASGGPSRGSAADDPA